MISECSVNDHSICEFNIFNEITQLWGRFLSYIFIFLVGRSLCDKEKDCKKKRGIAEFDAVLGDIKLIVKLKGSCCIEIDFSLNVLSVACFLSVL